MLDSWLDVSRLVFFSRGRTAAFFKPFKTISGEKGWLKSFTTWGKRVKRRAEMRRDGKRSKGEWVFFAWSNKKLCLGWWGRFYGLAVSGTSFCMVCNKLCNILQKKNSTINTKTLHWFIPSLRPKMFKVLYLKKPTPLYQ